MKTIKLNQPVRINGGDFVFHKGDVVRERDVPPWVFDLLRDGYADEVKQQRAKKQEE